MKYIKGIITGLAGALLLAGCSLVKPVSPAVITQTAADIQFGINAAKVGSAAARSIEDGLIVAGLQTPAEDAALDAILDKVDVGLGMAQTYLTAGNIQLAINALTGANQQLGTPPVAAALAKSAKAAGRPAAKTKR